jgi:hypothetical protein
MGTGSENRSRPASSGFSVKAPNGPCVPLRDRLTTSCRLPSVSRNHSGAHTLVTPGSFTGTSATWVQVFRSADLAMPNVEPDHWVV